MIESQHSRAHLSPLSPSPWLDDLRLTYRSVGVLTVALLCLIGTMVWCLRAPNLKPSVLMAVLSFVGVGGVIVGIIQLPLSLLWRRRHQTCPACLCSMDRGATTCPHCQFQPAQEDL